jgi:hypothetical protein
VLALASNLLITFPSKTTATAMNNKMRARSAIIILCLLVCFALLLLTLQVNVLHAAESSPNGGEYPPRSTAAFKAAVSYEEAIRVWKTPEDINNWITAHFTYDMARALLLSETQRAKNEKISIYEPSTLFDTKSGMCVDLSRFAFETLRRIDPACNPKFLMIEFDPKEIEGNVLRLHWLVSFKRDGRIYFFADSNRPGYITGPYNDVREFINEYERYRGRTIVAFQELESYQKQQRTPARKRQVQEKKP